MRAYLNDSILRKAYIKRAEFSSKYDNGRVLIIGGSSSYHGAPILATNSALQSLAALRVGTGYVKAFVPQDILSAARSLSPNTIIQACGKSGIVFNQSIKEEISRADVIVIGMGIGKAGMAAAKKIIEYSLKKHKKVIADAEAIGALRRLTTNAKNNLLVTPHDKEFFRLTGKLPTKDMASRAKLASQAAREMGLIILLKGQESVITNGKTILFNKAKTPALATMGTGDVLCGIIAGYAAIGNNLFDAAAAGVYLHSKIGNILHSSKGNHIIATDVIAQIPTVLRLIESK